MKISKKIFEKEIGMCQELFKNKKGCNWGKCQNCGVVPMLYRLHAGLIVENKKDVAKLKNAYLKNSQK